jgi:hypothetical protein
MGDRKGRDVDKRESIVDNNVGWEGDITEKISLTCGGLLKTRE